MGRVLATSDWHSCDFYNEILNQLEPDDTLYFIGDAIDRGPAGIATFNALHNDKRVIMMKGNHEDLLAKYIESDERMQGYVDGNGGNITIASMAELTNEQKIKYAKLINKLPEKLIYHSPKGHVVILEHAGYSPFDIPYRSHDPLWDRTHFGDIWDAGGFNMEGLDPKNTYLVHGHTPVHYLKYVYGFKDKPALTISDLKEKEEFFGSDDKMTIKPEIIRYCGGHKFDIDMCIIITDRVALLNLDTFEEIYFDRERLVK